ncbi:MAG: acetyl-CoA carboxylase biotin carboxyl carrier protein [Pirellulales bacterium]
MGDSEPKSSHVFDVDQIRQLVELMQQHDLGEIDLREGEQRVRLRRGREPEVRTPTMVAAPPPASAAAPTPAAPAGGDDADAGAIYVTSPMVGTFYAAGSPDAAAFVKVGDHVGKDTIVCIVEAMKVFNEIPAEVAGRVTSILVENGDPVEYGQKLFKIDPNG